MMLPLEGLTLGNRAAHTRWAATATTLLGLVALTGWAFRIPALADVLPGSVEMKPTTALALILCGIALLLLVDRVSLVLERLAQALALAAAVIGLASFDGAVGTYSAFGERMSPYTAGAFIAIGLALAAAPHESLRRAAKFAAAPVVIVGLVSLLGHIWNAAQPMTGLRPSVPMNTAICFVLLGAGALVAPSRTAVSREAQTTGRATVETKILMSFLLAMVLLLFSGGYTHRTNVDFADSVEWIAHTQEVRATLADIYGSLATAELAQRDYLLSADHARLEEYARLIKVVRDSIEELGRLTLDNSSQQQNLTALTAVVARSLDDLSSDLVANRQDGLTAEHGVPATNRRIDNARDVHGLIERMDAVEVQLLAKRQAAASNVRHTMLVALLTTLAVASLVFFALFRGIHREMTARQRSDKERGRILIELQLAQKLESVGRLAAGIAHEINNPIQFVSDSVHFLRNACDEYDLLLDGWRNAVDVLPDGPLQDALRLEIAALAEKYNMDFLRAEMPQAFDRICDGVERVAKIVTAMKEFGHPDAKEQNAADINHAIGTTLLVASNEYRYIAKVHTDFAELPQVVCNIGELNQVFLNLIVNAAHAIQDAGRDIDTGKITIATALDGDAAVVRITDNGCGVTAENLSKIYDPFFTTKEVGRGTGQGLAITHSIVVDKHGGRIDVASSVGAGTEFTLRLPIHGRSALPST